MIATDQTADHMGTYQPHETDDAQKSNDDCSHERGNEHTDEPNSIHPNPQPFGGFVSASMAL